MANELDTQAKTIVVIPVYNHGGTLRKVVEGVLASHRNVIVVNDGSTDGGPATIEDLPVGVIHHQVNLGKGAAIMSAAEEAKKMGMTHIVTIDADGQHNPSDIPRFLQAISEHPGAIIIGTRVFEKNSVPFGSRFGRAFSNFWFRVQTGQIVKDTQSGFRSYPVAVLSWLKLHEKRYSFEIEVLVRAAWAGIELEELVIPVHYPAPHERISHFHPFLDNFILSILNTRLTMLALLPIPRKKFITDAYEPDKISILRPVQSLKSLLKRNFSPAKLAASGGMGVFIGSLPLIACQTITILGLASFFRLNKLTALATSQLCIPPIVPALCIETGYFIRNGRFLTEISLETIGYQALHRLLDWFIGSLVLGPVLGAAMGVFIYAGASIMKPKKRAAARNKP